MQLKEWRLDQKSQDEVKRLLRLAGFDHPELIYAGLEELDLSPQTKELGSMEGLQVYLELSNYNTYLIGQANKVAIAIVALSDWVTACGQPKLDNMLVGLSMEDHAAVENFKQYDLKVRQVNNKILSLKEAWLSIGFRKNRLPTLIYTLSLTDKEFKAELVSLGFTFTQKKAWWREQLGI